MVGDEHSISDAALAARYPSMAGVKLNKLYHQRFAKRTGRDSGIDIFDRDWDNLVILDACRYDAFEARADLDGDLEAVTSKGSATKEFVAANFGDRTLHDTVYVSANGWFLRLREQIRSEVHEFRAFHTSEYRDNPSGTTLPSTLTKHAAEAAEEFPHKRLVVHYVQPHRPYLGPTGREHFGDTLGMNLQQAMYHVSGDDRRGTLRRAYAENLDIVLSEVESLLDRLTGRTVVTADHGELLGERMWPIPVRGYGHPIGVRQEELVTVPWLVRDDGPRREIRADAPTRETTDASEETVEHLKDLGYAV